MMSGTMHWWWCCWDAFRIRFRCFHDFRGSAQLLWDIHFHKLCTISPLRRIYFYILDPLGDTAEELIVIHPMISAKRKADLKNRRAHTTTTTHNDLKRYDGDHFLRLTPSRQPGRQERKSESQTGYLLHCCTYISVSYRATTATARERTVSTRKSIFIKSFLSCVASVSFPSSRNSGTGDRREIDRSRSTLGIPNRWADTPSYSVGDSES